MLAAKWSAGVAPELSFMEHVTHTPLSRANKAAHSGFETQSRRHQKSETGRPHEKDLYPSKIILVTR